MTYLWDFAEDATVYKWFNTVGSDGSPITIGGTAAAQVYKNGGTTQITAGVTVTEDFDGVTGLHLLTVDMSADAAYTTGADYVAVLSVGTADGVSIVGGCVVQWSCENRRVNAIKDGAITTNTFDTGVLATDADIADAVWDEPRADHATADTFGEGIATTSAANTAIATAVWAVDASTSITLGSVKQTLVTDIPGTLAALNDLDSAAVTAACTSSLTTYDPPTRTEATSDKAEILTRLGMPAGADVSTDIAAIVADTNELQTDWVNGGRLDLLLDQAATAASVPTAATIADAVLDEALSGHATAGTLGKAVTDILAGGSAPTVEQIVDGILDEPVASHATAGSVGAAIGASSTTETRDLEPVQHVWRFSRRSGGDIVASNVLNIAPGETIRAGFECAASIVLPAGAVLATMTAATPSSGDVIATKLGIDVTQAKVSVVAADDATTGETHYVRCEVTNSLGGGPLVLLGPVTVRAEPS